MASAECPSSTQVIVQVDYTSLSELKPKPSDAWTRFVCVSDTHSHEFEVPPGDVLLHGGDLTNTGTVENFKKTMDWLYALPHTKKIIIAGNHDLTLHAGWYDVNWQRWHGRYDGGKQQIDPILEMLKGPNAQKAGVIYLEDEETQFQVKEGGRTWSVYGSPWSPWFYDWAFNYNRGKDAENLVSKFPKTDILLTHGPPHRIFDVTTGGEFVGCEALTARLPSLKPRIHVFGHIHEAHGAHVHHWKGEYTNKCPEIQNDEMIDTGSDEAETTVFVNAANWPMGQRARKFGTDKFGGKGFGPVVVDLLD